MSISNGKCPTCGGRGKIEEATPPEWCKPLPPAMCGLCGGDGLARNPVQEMVKEFHTAFQPEQTAGTPPRAPDDKSVRLRLKLIFEEAFELLEACDPLDPHVDFTRFLRDQVFAKVDRIIVQPDIVKVADALADIAYVVEGSNLAYGIDGRPVLAEVHASNMSKVGGHRRADGKWEKPPTYRPADIEGELRKQGWKPEELEEP